MGRLYTMGLMGRASRRSTPTPSSGSWGPLVATIHMEMGRGTIGFLGHPLPTGQTAQSEVQGKGLNMSWCHSWYVDAEPELRALHPALKLLQLPEVCWGSLLTPQAPAPTATSPRNPPASRGPSGHLPEDQPPALVLQTGMT